MHRVQISDRGYAEWRLPPGTLYARTLRDSDKRTSENAVNRKFELRRITLPRTLVNSNRPP